MRSLRSLPPSACYRLLVLLLALAALAAVAGAPVVYPIQNYWPF